MMTRATPWVVALLLSILANGVMLGVVLQATTDGPRAGSHHMRGDGPPSRRGGDGFNFRAFIGALPDDARDDARTLLDAQREDLRALFRQTREAQIAAQDAVAAEPYDPDRVRRAFDELRDARMAMEEAVEAIILDVVADLSPEDRMRAIEAGRAPPPRHRRGGRDGRRGPPPRDRF